MRSWRMQDLLAAATLTLVIGGVAAGCGAPSSDPEPAAATDSGPPVAESTGQVPVPGTLANPLADTEWRLVEFLSMDDSIGAIRPDDPSAYTMRLDGDGTVAMQLGCNRGAGTWAVEFAEDGQSGRFEFGLLATTRAFCPPPSMDQRIAADADFVRGFLLRDGRLYLSLVADTGIYEWEPLANATPAETST